MAAFKTRQEETTARAEVWQTYLETEKKNNTRHEEMYWLLWHQKTIDSGADMKLPWRGIMYFDEATRQYSHLEKSAIPMRFTGVTQGEPGENGYPLYIVLHGGGQTLINELSYEFMIDNYKESIENSIQITCRGIRETYNCHFNPESYPLYDRLIQNMIIFGNVDPNRVYLMGYSAGGDGVYGITPYMADRFAAVSMSAGHHNNISPINFMNTPIILQCGDDDTAYDRHLETARFGDKLKALRETWPEQYEHIVNMHVARQHGISDDDAKRKTNPVWENSSAWLEGITKTPPQMGCSAKSVNTNAVDFLKEYTRNPLPKTVAWDLSTRSPLRPVKSFYWLQADEAMTSGIIYATLDTDNNSIKIDTQNVTGTFRILLNWDMVDYDRPVSLVINGVTRQEKLTPSREVVEETTQERGDVNYQFSVKVEINV